MSRLYNDSMKGLVIEMPKCDFCRKASKFEIRRIKDEMFYNVCGIHDNFIGIENLEAQGLSHVEAVKINKTVKNYKP